MLIATCFLTEGARVSVTGDELSLHGKVETETTKVALQAQLPSVFAGKIDNLLLVVPPPLVENGICQEFLNQLLDSARINFEPGNASITPYSNDLILNIANTAKRCPNVKLEVADHTDSIGTTDVNMALSQSRAMAVVAAVMQPTDSGSGNFKKVLQGAQDCFVNVRLIDYPYSLLVILRFQPS